MSPIRSSLLLGAGDAAAGGFQVSRSLRFNSADSAYLNRTPSVAGNRKTWTWAGWVKRSKLGTLQYLLQSYGGGSYRGALFFDTDDKLYFYLGNTSSSIYTTAVFRDVSAWYHIVAKIDTTQAAQSAGMKLYVNGVEQVVTNAGTYTQNDEGWINSTNAHQISGTSSYYFDGYLANIQFIDGQALDPSSFTEVSATTGQLIPKAYSGTYGTNGFYLKFADNSTTAALGTDSSGNGNNWTVNNLYPGGANYSSRGSLSASPPILSGTIADIFDGSLAASGGSFSVNQANAGVTVSFSPALPSGSLVKLIGNVYGTAGSNSSLQVNGTSYAQSLPSSPGTGTDTELSVPAGTSGITSIYIYREGVSNFNYTLFGITVDGILLVDAAAGASTVDSPTSYGTDTGVGGEVRGNYATLNPLNSGGSGTPTLTNGNLDFSLAPSVGAIGTHAMGSIAVNAGKYYWEVMLTSNYLNSSYFGLMRGADYNTYHNTSSGGVLYFGNSGNKVIDGTFTSYGSSYTNNDIIGIALDLDAGTVVFYKNNTSQGTITLPSSTTGWKPYVGNGSSGGTQAGVINFGQRAFAYTAPSSFKALVDTNLPTPVVAKPNTLMDVALYTGNSSVRSITGFNFSPDFVWIKPRSVATQHNLYDAVRGATKALFSDFTDAEATVSNGLTAFNSDGFSLGSNQYVNDNAVTFVAWAWDAGTSTVSNTQGSITSQVRANASAGFSVVTFTSPTGTGNFSAGHGLGVTPEMVIVKSRDATGVWYVYHKSLATDHYLRLNATNASATDGVQWGAGMTSTVLGLRASYSTVSGATTVAYAFAPVSGYSAMGSYVSNSNSDGPFIWTGFRSRFLMIKNTTDTTYSAYNGWFMVDTARTPANVPPGNANALYANKSQVENTDGAGAYSPQLAVDILANGFKLRCANTEINYNATYIYFAVAENPFQYARAR